VIYTTNVLLTHFSTLLYLYVITVSLLICLYHMLDAVLCHSMLSYMSSIKIIQYKKKRDIIHMPNLEVQLYYIDACWNMTMSTMKSTDCHWYTYHPSYSDSLAPSLTICLHTDNLLTLVYCVTRCIFYSPMCHKMSCGISGMLNIWVLSC
jgi:hypothetical protein